MIAKASTISHGANAIRYSVNKEKADIVKANFLPDDISPEAMYGRMMLVQKKFAENINKGRPLARNVIRIEISPSEEESRNWTMDDWVRLSNEFIRVFDSIDLSGKTKRISSKQTNLKGSQYIVALHRDSKSGILHLHIDANRVDMDGKINDSHKIGKRAVMAANIINERRGWVQSEEIGIRHRQEISDSCMEILRTMDEFSWQRYEMELVKRGYKVHLQEKDGGGIYGYSIKRGNSIYKSSVLGIGRNLTPSKIEATWAKLHPQERKSDPAKPVPQQIRTADTTPVIQPPTASQPVMKHYDIATDEYHSFHVAIPESADNIIRQDCSLEEAHPLAKIEEIQHTALLLFAGYIDAATSMAASSGGGGSDTSSWGRDKDEDELEWARRCARMANSMCKRKKGLHR
ncbi:relaxase/mobilization nuclease domain-containing protein [Bacteroides gallinaceum]|uniref:relaxase/mobilization nuclease domain-containing protein n=1 Tax=Bacteroides gallinaceum TaxID=1462571 RepID=UPI0025A40382|nr:relaxase/mobilization nuclease domain-containing protein [Bacteroides gallinaceum]MDM8209131.1 relaxase/mobilization nuclease domain-containing protein [Bacteroides gallinaceum]